MKYDSPVAHVSTLKNLFDSGLAGVTKRRILQLSNSSQRLWGTLTVSQMLAHCTSGLDMAMGVINLKRDPFPANAIGLLVKPLVLGNDKPLRRNSPSSPELFCAQLTDSDIEQARSHLIAAVDRFVEQGPACCARHPHPFFGPLKPEQWAVLMYKHLDHHLRQFGV
jgi:hypothetical protein